MPFRCKVLLVDDQCLIRQGLRMLLEGHSSICVVGEAQNGHEAIKQVARIQPDMVIMDVDMPVMNGIEAARLIKQAWPHVIIVGLSVSKDPATRYALLKVGAVEVLDKGQASEELERAILRHSTSGEPRGNL